MGKCRQGGAGHETPGHGDGGLPRTQSSQPSVHLSSAGCGSFHRLLAVLCFPKVTLGQGSDIPHHAFHPQGPAGKHQPQALYCPDGPSVLMPKLMTLALPSV